MANKNDKFIEVFDVQAEVLSKISELKTQGYREDDMYVIADNDDQLSMVQGQTDVNVDSQSTGDGNGDWADKFKSLFTGEDSTKGAFDRMNLSESESDQYHQQLKNGKILLYVDSDYGSTFNDQTTAGTEHTRSTSAGRASGTDEESIRLHEERLNVDKERVQTGEVNVGKHVVEEEKTIEVPVEREEVYVERRPVNEETDTTKGGGLSGKDAYQDGDNIRIPVSEERVDVSKKEVVGEEIVVGKKKVKDTEHVSETVRHEEADIDEGANRNQNSTNRGL